MISPHEQLAKAILKAERPLLILPAEPTVDGYAAMIAINEVAKLLQKNLTVVSTGGNAPSQLAFLSPPEIKSDLTNLRSLTVQVNTKKAKVEELSYSVDGEVINIHLLPKQGFWTTDDIKILSTAYRYDLILALGLGSLSGAGQIFLRYQDFFYETAIINLDFGMMSEEFGQINLVDQTATSLCETVANALPALGEEMLTPAVATALLTGIISQTNSFKDERVTTKTLNLVAKLMAAGAKREEINQKLYRTKSVETLKLWGKALGNLRSEPELRLVWTMLTRQDFLQTGANEEALQDIVQELLRNSPEAQVVVIFEERGLDLISIHIHAERPFDALALGAPFKAAGSRQKATLLVPEENLQGAEKVVMDHLKKTLREGVRGFSS
ncbi:MAG: hypothetical protein AAB833_00190 [Patescibacteria group bacterium]